MAVSLRAAGTTGSEAGGGGEVTGGFSLSSDQPHGPFVFLPLWVGPHQAPFLRLNTAPCEPALPRLVCSGELRRAQTAAYPALFISAVATAEAARGGTTQMSIRGDQSSRAAEYYSALRRKEELTRYRMGEPRKHAE